MRIEQHRGNLIFNQKRFAMLRDTKPLKDATITVVLKDGGVFSRRDTTSEPLGDAGKFVCFWDNDDLKIIPMQNVYDITMHFNKEESQ